MACSACLWLPSRFRQVVRAEDATTHIKTSSPIKHVIIIVGENRSFDHLFATYVPKSRDERVLNLLSEHIIKADGTPDENFAKAHQFQVTSAPNGASFFISAPSSKKSLYATLPAPDLGGVQNPTGAPILGIPGGDPGLPAADQFLFGTGGTGLPVSVGPDTRITNVNNLPPGPFQMTGPTMPYDAYTADTIHQFFQMYQQVDCAIDAEHVTRHNPTGCLHDLQSFVTTTYTTPPGGTPHDTGQTMAFFNMQKSDVPLSEVPRRPVHDERQLSSAGDGRDRAGQRSARLCRPGVLQRRQRQRRDAAGQHHLQSRSAAQHAQLNTRRAKQWFNCSDPTQPGIKPILDYLNKLPYPVQTKCDTGAYYNAVNVNPAWTPQGTAKRGRCIPPVTMTSIGDLLSAKNIPWKYYGGSYNVSGTGAPLDGIYCNICNPFEYQVNYPAMRADHMRDVTDLFNDLKNGTLPAVSYVKPDGAMDGHPASSKFNLFEAFAKNIIQLAQSNKELWESTAIFVTVDEGGGFYDSGFIQPVDFFGTGPRIPMIAVSPFSRGGHITHVYGEHSSFVKFVERNWYLGKLSERSRDNLPNPRADDDNHLRSRQHAGDRRPVRHVRFRQGSRSRP